MTSFEERAFLETLFIEAPFPGEAFDALTVIEGHPEAEIILQAAMQLASTDKGRAALRLPSALGIFLRLSAQGRYPTLMLTRHPEDLIYLVDALSKRVPTVEEISAELRLEIANHAGDRLGAERLEVVEKELRRFKRRQSLRIFHEESEGDASVRQTTAQIADVAEACLEVGIGEVARFLGDVSLAQDLCVLGMGKLGGRELNYSSDIDLVYLGSDRLREDDERRRLVDQLARRLTAIIDETTRDGYVFRVDLRLRPEGSQGPLVQACTTMIDYYLSWGRTWERSAMLKAREVAGNRALGAAFLQGIEPFLFRRYLDFSVIGELRAMKQLVNDHARIASIHGRVTEQDSGQTTPVQTASAGEPRKTSTLAERLQLKLRAAGVAPAQRPLILSSKGVEKVPEPGVVLKAEAPRSDDVPLGSEGLDGVLGWDVKLGVGGIREIEFFVQALQLIHCGSRAGLRVRNTLDALDRLLYVGLLSHEDHACLADAYDLFRRLEHRVQMEEDRQDHRLPDDLEHFRRLSARMGRKPERLREEVTESRRRVATMFARLFEESDKVAERPTVQQARPVELSTILAADSRALYEPAVLSAFAALGFARPQQVAGQLQVLREKSYGPFALTQRFQQGDTASYLLGACAASPYPDQAFTFLSRLFLRVGDTPGFYRMLSENPHAARLLIHLFGSSPPLAHILIRDPDCVERLLSAGTAAFYRERETMAADLARRLLSLTDPGHRLGRVRRFHQEETLRIALHEIAGVSTLDQTVAQLSDLAEVIIEAVLKESFDALRARSDEEALEELELRELPFVVVGMGKLGGRELGFGGDLDMIFVYEADEARGLTHSFYTRLAQRLIRGLSMATESGNLYEVDMRLRPSGSQGTLVVSLDAFRNYHDEKADLWERQALIKARAMTGTAALKDAFEKLRQDYVFRRPLPENIAEQLLAMRAQMLEAADLGPGKGEGAKIDIKMSPGGLVDVEFLTQYLQLSLGHELVLEQGGEAGEELDERLFSRSTVVALEAAARRESAAPSSTSSSRIPGGGEELASLAQDYRTLRRIETRLRMSDERGESLLPEDEASLDVLARRLGYQGKQAGRQLQVELKELRERVCTSWREVFVSRSSIGLS